MVEPCDNCTCGLADGDRELKETEFPLQLQFASVVRSHILGQTGIDPDTAFIKSVEICPEKVVVQYKDR